MTASTDGLEVIDADGHVQEPGDLWNRYMDDDAYRAYRPLIDPVATDNMMSVAGRAVPRIMMREPRNADYRDRIVRDWHSAFGSEFDKGPDGFSSEWYLSELDREGIDRMVLYPSRGLYACAVDDLDSGLADAIARAYNRWLADFCSRDRRRLVPVALATLHSPGLAATQLEYCATELGCTAVMVRPNPVQGRNLDHPANDVFWAKAQELDMTLATHEGTGVWMSEWGSDRFRSHLAQHAMSHVMEAMQAVYCFTTGGILERFPRLRVAFLEAGGSWLPSWLHRLDEHAEQLEGVESETGRITKLPSEYFREQCWIGCEPDEPHVDAVFDHVGADRVVWASDFPHPDGKYPNMIEYAVKTLSDRGVDSRRIAGYVGGNAKTLYRLA